ncbi:MAG: RNase P/RNase MRP complex subunit [Marteilia pararefringens]
MKEQVNFKKMCQINKFWIEYLHSIVKEEEFVEPKIYNLYQKILKLELFGCYLTVTRSKCIHFVLIKGFVCCESSQMLSLIDEDEKIRYIPKKGSIFSFEIHGHMINLIGDQMIGNTFRRLKSKLKPPSTFVQI